MDVRDIRSQPLRGYAVDHIGCELRLLGGLVREYE